MTPAKTTARKTTARKTTATPKEKSWEVKKEFTHDGRLYQPGDDFEPGPDWVIDSDWVRNYGQHRKNLEFTVFQIPFVASVIQEVTRNGITTKKAVDVQSARTTALPVVQE